MADPALRRATYQDVLDAPSNKVAEIVNGVLHVSPRPAKPHTLAASALGGELIPPFRRGRGGPGGWFILHEPELHFDADVVVPDLAGWRCERMPVLTLMLRLRRLALGAHRAIERLRSDVHRGPVRGLWEPAHVGRTLVSRALE